jgi:hypothetical protein
MVDVFISYSRKDVAPAARLARGLLPHKSYGQVRLTSVGRHNVALLRQAGARHR